MKAEILVGDVRSCLAEIPDKSVQCVVTSPPYWGLRDYETEDQIGLERTPQEYIAEMVSVFREVWRVLADDGVLWLNLGDSYFSKTKGTGGMNPETSPKNAIKGKVNFQAFTPVCLDAGDLPIKPKDLVGIPWRVAFALQDAGWYLRQDIIWAKPNPMPESVRDRCTKSHEYIFMLTKQPRYHFDNDAIKEPSADLGKRNKRDVWTIPTRPFKGAHFAVMPEAVVEPCILASSRPGDTVLDPFSGSGTVGVVSLKNNRNYVGIELNPEYAQLSSKRIQSIANLLIDEIITHKENIKVIE